MSFSTLFQLETVYAGMRLDRDGTAVPGLMGRLCQWSSSRPAVTFTSYQDFHNSLNLDCPPESMEGGVEPAVLSFTPTRDMPDTLYYQSFTTKHLGGIIRILDRCDDDHRGHRRDRNKDITTFRPDLDKYYERFESQQQERRRPSAVSFGAVQTAPAEDQVQLLQSLMVDGRRRTNRRSDFGHDGDDGTRADTKKINNSKRRQMYRDDDDDDGVSDSSILSRRRRKRKKVNRAEVTTLRPRSNMPNKPHLMSNCVRRRMGLAAADGMPVFEHFPKRTIDTDRAAEVDYEDCYEDEITDPYDKPFQHPSENIQDFQDVYHHQQQEAPDVHSSGFFGMGSPMIPSQVTTPKWVRPTPEPTRRPPALTMDRQSHNSRSSGYEKKKKSATSYVSMSRPKKQATSYVSHSTARPKPTERPSSHRKKDSPTSFVTFSLDSNHHQVKFHSTQYHIFFLDEYNVFLII